MNGRVLIIAGSDSGGGAGIQADIKAVTALGGFAMTAITALTAQNTTGVQGIHEVPADFVRAQMESVLTDLGADAVKIGMLHRPEIIDAVADGLAALAPGVPVVLDPVMVAKGGAALLEDTATRALANRLVPWADLLTPNAPEAAALTGRTVEADADVEAAAKDLLGKGARAVLMKGGHLPGGTVVDRLFGANGEAVRLSGPRIDTRHTHGTGCTLASACAVGIAQGLSLREAVERAHAYVRRAIETAPGYGAGHGPLNHAHTLDTDA
ncbi:MAG: bifunctional hydroxymethylpyrimidine kinase/phosphomethylpyrimidine kinase [Rhodospirillaceae bacterium]